MSVVLVYREYEAMNGRPMDSAGTWMDNRWLGTAGSLPARGKRHFAQEDDIVKLERCKGLLAHRNSYPSHVGVGHWSSAPQYYRDPDLCWTFPLS